MQNISLTYSYTKEHIKNLYRFSVFPIPKAKYFFGIITFVIFGVSAIAFGFKPSDALGIQLFSVIKILMKIAIALWSFIIIVVTFVYYRVANSSFKNNPAFHGVYRIFLSEAHYAFNQKISNALGEKETNATVNWTAFTKKAESELLIILYQKGLAYPIPKNAFASENELNEFKRFLTQQTHIKPKTFSRIPLWKTEL